MWGWRGTVARPRGVGWRSEVAGVKSDTMTDLTVKVMRHHQHHYYASVLYDKDVPDIMFFICSYLPDYGLIVFIRVPTPGVRH